MSDTLIIIPTYNEIENIEPLTRAVIGASNEVDILIVDDNSPDGTGKKADELESLELELMLYIGIKKMVLDVHISKVFVGR